MASASLSMSSSMLRFLFLIGLFAFILVISSTQVMAAKDLADHRISATTTQEEISVEMSGTKSTAISEEKDPESPKSGHIDYGSTYPTAPAYIPDSKSSYIGYGANRPSVSRICRYGCCAPLPCYRTINCRASGTGSLKCTRCCSSADEARNAAASVQSNNP